MSYLHSITSFKEFNNFTQKDILSWMKTKFSDFPVVQRKLDAIYSKSGIENRQSVLNQFKSIEKSNFYNSDLSPNTSQRNQIFITESLKASITTCKNTLLKSKLNPKDITHIITVTCTGLYAPGIEFQLINELGLNKNIQRFPIQFVGCYAMFTAVNLANNICKANEDANVLILGVELCTLHFQDSILDDDLLSNSLFADGCAAAIMSKSRPKNDSLQLETTQSVFLPTSLDLMSWTLSETGFQMKLSSYVPNLLQKSLKEIFNNYIFDLETIFAIHPGGRKILDTCQSQLEIKDLKYSRSILSKFGNMSSVTILYVLNEILEDHQNIKQNTKIVSMGFGPGLTFENINYVYEKYN